MRKYKLKELRELVRFGVAIESFSPGSSVSKPDWEKVLYCPRREEQKIRNYLDSIVHNILFGMGV